MSLLLEKPTPTTTKWGARFDCHCKLYRFANIMNVISCAQQTYRIAKFCIAVSMTCRQLPASRIALHYTLKWREINMRISANLAINLLMNTKQWSVSKQKKMFYRNKFLSELGIWKTLTLTPHFDWHYF